MFAALRMSSLTDDMDTDDLTMYVGLSQYYAVTANKILSRTAGRPCTRLVSPILVHKWIGAGAPGRGHNATADALCSLCILKSGEGCMEECLCTHAGPCFMQIPLCMLRTVPEVKTKG